MAEFDFTAFVKNLPKEKLVELFLKYAPESYREEVINQHLDGSLAKAAFDKLSKQIKRIFDNEELLYEPSDFESKLVGLSEKLSGFWDKFPDETGDIFLFCINRIVEIQDEGLLYNSYYDEALDGRSFLEIIQRYGANLPFKQKIEFVGKLEKELESFSYDTFYSYPDELNLIYSDSEKPLLKELFFQAINNEDKPFRKHYYKFLKDTFNLEEKVFVLEKIYHLDKFLCLELVETLVELQKPELAIEYLEALKEANSNPWVFTEDLFMKLIQLKSDGGVSFLDELETGLKTYKTNTLLDKAIQYFPEKSLEFESIIESTSHYYFLKYLIGENRLDEAHLLVKKSNTLDKESIYNFYTTYCKRYTEDATTYFIQLINKELPHTGDQHYEAIVDSLQYIRKVNRPKALEITEMLKREYKRRRNLMALLDGF